MKKILKKSLITCLIASMCITIKPMDSKAATMPEMEYNGSLETAQPIVLGDEIVGSISELSKGKDEDFYKMELETTGKIHIDLTSYIRDTYYSIYDAEGNKVYESSDLGWDSNIKQLHYETDFFLKKGSYYFKINSFDWGDCYGDYKFKIDFTSSNVNHLEESNTFSTAEGAEFSKKYIGQISNNDNADFYKFTVENAATYHINVNSSNKINIGLYKESGDEIAVQTSEPDSNISKAVFNQQYSLQKGTYVVRLEGKDYSYYYGTYDFKMYAAANNVKLNKGSLVLKKGKSYQLRASVTPAIAENKAVVWSTSEKAIATVSSAGKVTGKKKGITYITCTSKDNNLVSRTIKVTVR